jgi:dimethylargininase
MLPFALPERVLVRAMSSRYADCLRSETISRIDVPLALAQHAAYVDAIRATGTSVETVPGDDNSPDACFIEDTAVITGRHALGTRPGAESRRAEVAPVARALAAHLEVHAMDGPATLDGGDVLRIGSALFVGISGRTNMAGAAALARVAALDGLTVTPLSVRGGLHLKSSCTLASGSLLLYDAKLFTDADLKLLRIPGLECLAAQEPAGANVLALGETVLVSASAPQTAAALLSHGLQVRMLDISEIHKGDGALTCLSLRAPRAGAWST